jgi:4-cresol dehydrogenase (hydroxylating)
MTDRATITASLEAIVGAANVLGIEAAGEYRARFGAGPFAVALPADVAQLQALVRGAAEWAIRLWVTPNTAGNGAQVGAAGGDIVLVDLKRMNKVLEVNASAAYALVEPGVSYADLNAHLVQNKLPLWVDCERNALNSVAGSAAAREFGFTAYGDRVLMQCGTEVMLADGSLVRTGMGALPNNNTWQLFKYGYGPYLDGLFMQSNFAIVTKIGIWLMPAPPAYHPFMATLPEQGLAAAVDVLRPLKIDMIVPNTVVIAHALVDVAPHARRADFLEGGTVAVDRVAAKFDLGTWNLYGALYGIADNIAILWGAVEGALKAIPGARVFAGDARGGDPVWALRERLMRGAIDAGADRIEQWSGTQRIEVGAAAPIDGADVSAATAIVTETLAAHGCDPLVEQAFGWRSVIVRAYLPFDHADAAAVARVRGCAVELSKKLAAAGYGVTHASAPVWRDAMRAYTDPGYNAVTDLLKKTFDPQDLLAPV